MRGYGNFVGANHVEVEETSGTAQEKTGSKKTISFKKAIIAAGSQAVRLPFMPNDPRVVDSTGALELKEVPKRMLILGGGIIGLEMGTVYSTLGARALAEGIEVTFAPAEEGDNGGIKAPAPQVYDLVLQAVGRTPNGKKISADKAVIPSVAYTDPEVAWVGLTEDQAKAQGIKIKKGLFPWTASGRAIANGRDEGVTKLLFDDSPEAHGHGKILGGGMVGTHAGDMIGEIALAIEMGADAIDIGKTIHPHPTLGESIGMAAEVAHGSCTDLPPVRK